MIIQTPKWLTLMNKSLLSDKPNLPEVLGTGEVSHFPKLPQGVAQLKSYGVIRVNGEEALSFLHNQLTQDFLNLNDAKARFCSFCNAKGRIQASFIGIKNSPTEVLLICSSDLIAQTVKRLSMFVLRAKVKVLDASHDFNIFGVIGQETQFNQMLGPVTQDASPWEHTSLASDQGTVHWITLYPSLGLKRFIALCPTSTNFHTNSFVPESAWILSEIMSGVCMIGLPTFESFVPQMINYESVGGVHFQKGCYPGQEIVARSQFRGTIKRRGFLIASKQNLRDGEELFINADPEQPCGQVVRSSLQDGIYYGFASMLLSASDTSSKIQTISSESKIEILPLPYLLREDL